jgi:hypothetical protein
MSITPVLVVGPVSGDWSKPWVIEKSDFWQKDTPVLAVWQARFLTDLYYTSYLDKNIKCLLLITVHFKPFAPGYLN